MVVVVGEWEPRPDFASPGSARPSRGELKRNPRLDTALNNAQPALVWRGRPRRPSHPSVLARVAGGLFGPGTTGGGAGRPSTASPSLSVSIRAEGALGAPQQPPTSFVRIGLPPQVAYLVGAGERFCLFGSAGGARAKCNIGPQRVEEPSRRAGSPWSSARSQRQRVEQPQRSTLSCPPSAEQALPEAEQDGAHVVLQVAEQRAARPRGVECGQTVVDRDAGDAAAAPVEQRRGEPAPEQVQQSPAP